MSRINPRVESRTKTTAHKNFMGGNSYFVSNPLAQLRMAASSCFFGEPMYYNRDPKDKRRSRASEIYPHRLTDAHVAHLRETLDAIDPQDWRGKTPAELIESAIDKALDFDAEKTLEEAVRLRGEDHMRTTPQVILVRAAHHPKVRGSGLLSKYGIGKVIIRADEPAVGLAYQLWRYGEDAPIPNALKKVWREALEAFTEYKLAKYRLEGHEVKTVDVVNLVHPKSEAIDKLVRGELKTTDQTWEAIISKEGSTTETWKKALDVMGHMALLRNLRNLIQKGVPEELFREELVKGAKHGQQLPFRYYSAYNAVRDIASPKVLDAIEECMVTALGNLSMFPGRTMALCDNSGSARGAMTSAMGTVQVSTIANLTAVIAGLRSEEGYVGVFGDELERFAVRTKASIFDQLDKANKYGDKIGQSTENGIWLFWDRAIREKEHWDNVFVFSDMQAGHGGLYGTSPDKYREFAWPGDERMIDVAKLVNTYRAKVNPGVRVFLVQMAGYQDTILPEFYSKTYILGGWGEGLLRFAASMAQLEEMPHQ